LDCTYDITDINAQFDPSGITGYCLYIEDVNGNPLFDTGWIIDPNAPLVSPPSWLSGNFITGVINAVTIPSDIEICHKTRTANSISDDCCSQVVKQPISDPCNECSLSVTVPLAPSSIDQQPTVNSDCPVDSYEVQFYVDGQPALTYTDQNIPSFPYPIPSGILTYEFVSLVLDGQSFNDVDCGETFTVDPYPCDAVPNINQNTLLEVIGDGSGGNQVQSFDVQPDSQYIGFSFDADSERDSLEIVQNGVVVYSTTQGTTGIAPLVTTGNFNTTDLKAYNVELLNDFDLVTFNVTTNSQTTTWSLINIVCTDEHLCKTEQDAINTLNTVVANPVGSGNRITLRSPDFSVNITLRKTGSCSFTNVSILPVPNNTVLPFIYNPTDPSITFTFPASLYAAFKADIQAANCTDGVDTDWVVMRLYTDACGLDTSFIQTFYADICNTPPVFDDLTNQITFFKDSVVNFAGPCATQSSNINLAIQNSWTYFENAGSGDMYRCSGSFLVNQTNVIFVEIYQAEDDFLVCPTTNYNNCIDPLVRGIVYRPSITNGTTDLTDCIISGWFMEYSLDNGATWNYHSNYNGDSETVHLDILAGNITRVCP